MNPYQKWNRHWWLHWWHEFTAIPYRLKRCYEWLPVIWNQGDCDQNYLYDLLAYKFERMERRATRTMDWNSQKRDLLICKNLMKRLRNDEYLDYSQVGAYKYHPYFKSERSVKQWSDYEQAMQRQDKELFCKIFLRKVDTWWD